MSARMNMTGLNQKWWDEALAIIATRTELLNDTELNFYESMAGATQTAAMCGSEFRPTIKQFNWLRQIAQAVK